MNGPLRRISFREFLKPNSRPYTLGDTEDANLLGMRLYGHGPFHREHKAAMTIAKKTHFVVRSGDVIYNKLFAWKGTFGIVPTEFDGMFVSDKFPTYELDRSIVDAGYLRWWFRVPDIWEQARLMSVGSAALSKLTLNPPRFLDLTIPIPRSLDAQKEIARKLDELSNKSIESKSLRQEAIELTVALDRSAASSILSSCPATGKLGDVLVQRPRNGWSPKCDNGPAGTAVLTLSAVTGWMYKPSAFKRTSLQTSDSAHYWLAAGDLLITRSNTPDFVGHVAIYNGEPSPCSYPDLMMKIVVDPLKAYVPFVWHWMQSSTVREYIKKNAKGTSPTMKKISQGIVCNTPFPVNLTVAEQRRVAAELDAMQATIAAVKEVQIGTSMQLDALLPTILDKAFKDQINSNPC